MSASWNAPDDGQSEQKQKLVDVIHDDTDTDQTDDKYDQRTIHRKSCAWFACGFIATLFAVQLIFVPHYLTKSLRTDIINAFVFTQPDPDNSHYQSWLTNSPAGSSVPIIFSIQFFNVTNTEDVLRGAIPKLNLTPPIVYNQYYHRRNVNFSDDGEWVNHTFYTEYLYNEELSELDPNTKLTVFSPLAGTLWHQWNISGWIEKEDMKSLVKLFEDDPNLLFWRNKKAADLIWDIYDFSYYDFSFHWGFMKNQSNQYYVVHTGHNEPSRMGEVRKWCRDPLDISCLLNDSTQYIDAWDPPMALAPGHLFYEGVYALHDLENKNNIPPLWIDILFRNIYLVYNGTYTYKGIELYKYGIQFDPQLQNASQYPPNSQFNQFGPSGILNASSAYSDMAIYLSMVLFFGAPDYLANNSKLSIPQPGAYDYPYIDIEPKTGSVFYANASMQICSPIHSLPNINNVSMEDPNKPNVFNLTDDMMIPIYLVTFSDAVTDKLANDFKSNLNLVSILHTASIVIGWISVVFLLVWCVLTVFGCGVYYHRYKMRNVN